MCFQVVGGAHAKRYFFCKTRIIWLWKDVIFFSVATESIQWATEERVVASQNFILSWEALRLW